MARSDKEDAVAELAEEFRTSSAAVLTEYRGLTVAQITALRRSLKGVANYAVTKNTLTKIAAREAGIEGLDDLLIGQEVGPRQHAPLQPIGRDPLADLQGA